jgi:hypothetical protein
MAGDPATKQGESAVAKAGEPGDWTDGNELSRCGEGGEQAAVDGIDYKRLYDVIRAVG